MKISVVVPVYNSERHVRSTLASVLAQTHVDWECVCVDDGSTDGSGAALDAHAAMDPRFRVIHQANGGEGAARNAGMDAATGEIVAFLDSDDVWHPETLRLVAETRLKTGADVIRYGWRAVSEHDGRFAPLPADAAGRAVDLSERRESTVRFCALGAATAVSRGACGGIRFSRLTQGADLVFVLDCLLQSRKVAYIDAPLLHYLTHPGQISRRVSKGLLVGSCGYIPEIVARCARLGERGEAWADTRRYACDLAFRRLFGAWRMLPDAAEREEARRAFWEMTGRLAAQPGFFGPSQRGAVAAACRRESPLLLRFAAVWPYRLGRRFSRVAAVCRLW